EDADQGILVTGIYPEVGFSIQKRDQCHGRHLLSQLRILSGTGLHLQALYSLRQDQLAIHTLGGQETNLVSAGIQLVESAEGTVGTVRDPVVAVVTKDQRLVAGRRSGHESGSLDGAV